MSNSSHVQKTLNWEPLAGLGSSLFTQQLEESSLQCLHYTSTGCRDFDPTVTVILLAIPFEALIYESWPLQLSLLMAAITRSAEHFRFGWASAECIS